MYDQTLFSCGPEDGIQLVTFVKSLGLNILPLMVGYDPPTEQDFCSSKASLTAGCLFTKLEYDEISHKVDDFGRILFHGSPVLWVKRSIYHPPYLSDGRLRCDLDKSEAAKYYRIILEWMSSNWESVDEDEYVGPHAAALLSAGAKSVDAITKQMLQS